MLTIGAHPERPLSTAHREALLALPTATLSDVLGPGHVLHAGITPLRSDWRAVGPALTVQLPASDNLGMHVAVRETRPGDILLVQQGAPSMGAPVGELMALAAQKQGAAGIVLDGPVRDRQMLRAGAFAVFASGRCAQACNKHGPAWINVPIFIGGRCVRPGDVIVADEDGVVVVPFERVGTVIQAARERQSKERLRIEGIDKGVVSPDWLAAAMAGAPVIRL